ncbi:MAG TPA: hypothetical protein VLR88_01640 [Propionibacteriaceae bacterium]|nr:hypothetical protein [Propionibacteriaceae bacterium]
MPVDYVVVAVAAIGAAMTASPAIFGRWRQPKLRRGAVAASALTLLIGIVAVFASLGSGISTPVAYTLLAVCVVLSAVGMVLIARDEKTPDAGVSAPEPPDAAVEGEETTPGDAKSTDDEDEMAPEDAVTAGDAPATRDDLREEALLFSTTTRHGWGAELAELLAADDTDDTPPSPPRRGA